MFLDLLRFAQTFLAWLMRLFRLTNCRNLSHMEGYLGLRDSRMPILLPVGQLYGKSDGDCMRDILKAKRIYFCFLICDVM